MYETYNNSRSFAYVKHDIILSQNHLQINPQNAPLTFINHQTKPSMCHIGMRNKNRTTT